MDQGERDITIRPELTASLGRIAAAYQREYTKPLKWFEIGSCFRYEKPQKDACANSTSSTRTFWGKAPPGRTPNSLPWLSTA